jgi:hypothetical protein
MDYESAGVTDRSRRRPSSAARRNTWGSGGTGRLLVEWVALGRNQQLNTRRLDEAEPVEPRRVGVARQAKAALLVSRVPAAQQLLELTEHDFGHDARLRIEDATLARPYDNAWRTRTLQPITSWTQDPWRQQTHILQQYAMMCTAPERMRACREDTGSPQRLRTLERVPKLSERLPPNVDDELATHIADTVVGIYHRELRGFEGAETAPKDGDRVYEMRLPVAAVAYAPLFDVMLRALQALPERPYEKTAWLYSFTLQGRLVRLRWTRNGLGLDLFRTDDRHHDDAADADRIARRLLSAARSFYRRVVEPQIEPSIAAGRAVVVNQVPRYRGMVDFHYRTIVDAQMDTTDDGMHAGSEDRAEAVRRFFAATLQPKFHDREQSYRATALIAGYFSWLQYLLVVLTAFSTTALRYDFSLQALLKAKWADQFDAAYPKPHDAVTKKLKADLTDLATEFRNPLLHGGGGRFEDGVVIEWAPGNQIMALNPDDLSDQYMILAPALTAAQVDDLLARIDRIDRAFEAHPFFNWAAQGLEADFRRDAITCARAALHDGVVTSYTNAASRAYDDSVN